MSTYRDSYSSTVYDTSVLCGRLISEEGLFGFLSLGFENNSNIHVYLYTLSADLKLLQIRLILPNATGLDI